MSSETVQWLAAFTITEAVEVPLYLHALGKRRGSLLIAAGASTLTHPIIWFVIAPRWSGTYASMVITSELFAWATETVYLAIVRVPRPWAWALGANAASFTVGLVIYWVGGIP